MPGTINLPVTNLPIGTREFGPANVNPNDTTATLAIDRTPANGLNATPSAVLEVSAMLSMDGGSTWFALVGGIMVGGQFFSPQPPKSDGALITQSSVMTDMNSFQGSGRRIKATLTVTGSPVTVAGTLTIT